MFRACCWASDVSPPVGDSRFLGFRGLGVRGLAFRGSGFGVQDVEELDASCLFVQSVGEASWGCQKQKITFV